MRPNELTQERIDKWSQEFVNNYGSVFSMLNTNPSGSLGYVDFANGRYKTISGAEGTVEELKHKLKNGVTVESLREYYFAAKWLMEKANERGYLSENIQAFLKVLDRAQEIGTVDPWKIVEDLLDPEEDDDDITEDWD